MKTVLLSLIHIFRAYVTANNLFSFAKNHLIQDYDAERGGSAKAPLQRQFTAYLRETGDWTILDAPTFGEGKNSWLTGTAAWTFVSISQAILGVQPTLDGLAVAPCIPAGWAGYTIKRRYRGAVYRITVENPHHVEKGIASITVDGTSITGNVLPPAAPGTEVQVRVVMG